jgi:mannose-6-phosphate isomerase
MNGNDFLHPLLFSPIYRQKIWGGQAFNSVLGKGAPARVLLGESWEISAYGKDTVSIVAGGELAGRPLTEICASNPHQILGPSLAGSARFPLLYKFIDANQRLSVQVHPDESCIRANECGATGKTEAWYIADARPGAGIVVGFRPGVCIEDVRAATRKGTLDSLLNHIDISRGDVLFVPAGTVHAICEGTLVYEVQQSSDMTFRLYDWGRNGTDGKPRALHVGDALAVLDTEYHENHKIPPLSCEDCPGYDHVFRVVCRYFSLEEYLCRTEGQVSLPVKSSFRVLTVLDGYGELKCEGGELNVHRGQSALLPYGLRNVALAGPAGFHFLVSSVPDIRIEILEPLRRMGFSDSRISQLGGWKKKNDVSSLMVSSTAL